MQLCIAEPSQLIMGLIMELNFGLRRSRLVPCSRFGWNFDVLVNKCNETLQGAISLVVNPLICARHFHFQSWEAADTEGDRGWKIVFRCIHFGTEKTIRYETGAEKQKVYMIR